MTLNTFLSPLGKLKDLEIVSNEQFGIISSYPISTPENKLTLTDWIFNELTFINEVGKLKTKINKKIKVKHFVPTEVKYKSLDNILVTEILPSLSSLDDIYGWIEDRDFEDEWDEISDPLLCKLLKDFLNIYNVRVSEFYNKKLILLKINPSEIRRNLFPKIQLIEKKEDKVIFNEFFEYIKDFHPYRLPKQEVKIEESTHNESKSKIPIELNCHPFHNNDVRDFHLYLESKYPNEINNTKSIFGAFWKFFEREGLIDSNEKKRIMKNYIDWINKRFDFQGDELITKLQTNTKSFPLSAFEKHYDKFEESKGDSFRFHDFRNENIQRTKKKRPSK